MLAITDGTSGDLLTPDELAAKLRVKVGTLYAWRNRRTGPPSLKVGGSVRYRRSDVDEWLARQTQ